jgi:hypothetical protein
MAILTEICSLILNEYNVVFNVWNMHLHYSVYCIFKNCLGSSENIVSKCGMFLNIELEGNLCMWHSVMSYNIKPTILLRLSYMFRLNLMMVLV